MNKYNLKTNSYCACIDIENEYRIQIGKCFTWGEIIPMKYIIYIRTNNPTKINVTNKYGNVLKTNPTYKDYPILYNIIGDV